MHQKIKKKNQHSYIRKQTNKKSTKVLGFVEATFTEKSIAITELKFDNLLSQKALKIRDMQRNLVTHDWYIHVVAIIHYL